MVIATAKNVPTLKDHSLEVKDWVLLRPEARRRRRRLLLLPPSP